ncbi:hypothetical protein CP532_0397 [Ophiocordyceps camponoti-leonardi (nom. inval.)]|nr:hypothetical protein CP532_0397 [Ophiocordyceps camponoti-leonardi (nom. inval.)]
MRVALAGPGDLSRYICQEFLKAGHDLVVLSRSHKPQLEQQAGITQFVTDYSLESLKLPLSDCQALISTIADVTAANIDVHRSLIRACRQSSSCKRFVPAEFGGDIESYPDQPAFIYPIRQEIRDELMAQKDIEWTLVSIGWMADYIVPSRNRYIKDYGDFCPVNLTGGTIVIPGSGTEKIDLTWARDVAKALAKLVTAPVWEPYTFISGEHTCWNDVASLVRKRYPEVKVEHQSLYKIVEKLKTTLSSSSSSSKVDADDDDTMLLVDHQLWSISQACSLPPEKVKAQREELFPGVHFRSLLEGYAELDENPDTIL